MTREARLVERTLGAFLASVASTQEPVPAGGSVAAMTGAASAGLLVLACTVRQKRDPSALGDARGRAEALQQQLTALIDDDAAAYVALLSARRAGEGVGEAVENAARVPLAIGAACTEVVHLAQEVEQETRGALLGDVRGARTLAGAAAAVAFALAEQDCALVDQPARQTLLDEVEAARSPLRKIDTTSSA